GYSHLLFPTTIHSPSFPYTTLFRSGCRGIERRLLLRDAAVGRKIAIFIGLGAQDDMMTSRAGNSVARQSPVTCVEGRWVAARIRSEEHTSELQSLAYLV